MIKVLITGANGFIGKGLLKNLPPQWQPILLTRQPLTVAGCQSVVISDLKSTQDYQHVLEGVEVVIHLAGRAHVLKETATDPLQAFREVNVEGTLALAKQALTAGVKRFIFLSSIGVNGQRTRTPFTEGDIPQPENAYSQSKWEAEQALTRLLAGTKMQWVIIRPPLVYGEGVKANFRTLLRVVQKGLPLPLGAIHNKRSLIALGNLVSFMLCCASHPQAANQTFLVTDDEDISTADLLKITARAMKKPCRLIAIPPSLLYGVATLLGKKRMAHQLCDSLQVSTQKAKNYLQWSPCVTLEHGIEETVACFLKDFR